MHDITIDANWTTRHDSEYADWYSQHPADPALLYVDPRVVFALSVALIDADEAHRYLPPLET